ncbi:sacsin-like [Ptychodera flava]|uniref:sacsin-like n=1 Tax=Ptychodera flava TaxID=63121 RepID=UPI00396A5110
MSMEMEIELTEKTHKAVKRWIVVHQVKKSGLSTELKKLSEDNDLGLMPWVGTAVEMVEANTIHISDGRIFCFLPLPPSQTTGLPVHIHGYFGLGDNRRSIKWPDAESKNDKTARWNQLLTCDAIPEAYAHLIMTAITVFKWKPDCVYRAWPDIQKVTSEEWQQVFKKLFSLLLVKEVFYSKVLGGKWLKLGDAAFDHPTSYKNKGNQEAVVKTMLDCCAPVVTLPPHVMKCLEHFRVHIKKITPHLVRLYLRKNTRTLESMDRKTKLQLLAYIIEDGSIAIQLDHIKCTKHSHLASRQKGEPPINWLGDFWSWFERQRGVDTSTLEGLPLIPLDADTYSGPITLLKLKKNGPSAIFKKTSSWQYQAVLNDEIASIIENIGCYIVRNQQSYLSQSSLGKYIASPDVDGVLKVLKFAGPLKITQLIKNYPQLSKQLSKYLSKLTNLSADDFTFLKQLPLFQCTNDNYPVSLNQCNTVTPNNYLELPCRRVKQSLLVCDEHSVLQFALSLGAIQIPFHKYLEQYILPGLESGYYSETESKGIMEWITNHSEYDDIVKRHRCILTKCGSLVKPCDAIDPNSIQLVLLLGDQCVPAEHYYEGRLLKHIRRIGMKAEDSISSTELYNIAKRLDSCKNSADENNVRKGGALLKYLEKYSWKLKEQVDVQRVRKSLSQRIMSLAWIPCLDHKPSWYMNSIEWFGVQNDNNLKLFTPKAVTIFENSMLIGGVMPIVKMTHLNQHLKNTFSWTNTLDGKNYEHVRCVVRQLKMIVSTTKKQQQPNLRQIQDTVIEIYKFLATSDIELVKLFIYDDSALGNFEWVWHGKGFTNQDKVALTPSLDVDLQPYLCILPVELASEFRTFFQAMGIHDKFSSTVLTDVLRSIKDSNLDKVSPEKYHADLNLACAILKAISSSGPVDDELHHNVLVPTNQSQDGNLKMVPASNCFYTDRDWLTEKLADDNYSIIHEDVPNVTARNLGLRPLSQHVAPTDDLGYDLAGPHETVINAIKRNLEIYKEGVGIFKELIQNADDAGASEVKFLIDQRSNQQVQERLLDPEMKHCHGPALWAYNNALFTDDDIKNICDIAAASKKEKPQPGVKLDLRNQRHRQTVATYPHQFQPYYRVFGCDITKDNYYEGTLFRLPLRTAYQVSHDIDNLISDKIYQDKTALQKLVLSLEKSARTLLLFTQNVKKLSVLELKSGSHDGKDAVEIFSINVNLVQQLPRCITHESALHLAPLQKQANILKATSQWMEQSKQSPPESTHLVAIKITSKLSKSTKKSTLKQHWLVSSCASNGVSFMRANQPEGRRQGVLPCAGVAALMKQSEDGLIPDPVKGQLFSFLPLAVPTGLPIHFNASFALQPNRRHIWSKATQIHDGSEWREFEAEWNHDLMTDVLCKAFINLLTDLAGIHDLFGKYDFQILWPKLDKCESDFHPFLMAFYQKVCGPADLQPAVIYNESKWVTLTRCLFVDEDISQSRIRNEAITLLNQQLYQKKVVTFNEAITRSIRKSGAADLLDKNTYDIRKLYTEVFFDCIDDISCDIRNPLVTHLLDIRMGAQQIRLFDDLLKNIECIPVSPGWRLYGCKAVNIVGSVAAVLDEHLLDRTLLTDDVMDILGIKTEVPVSEVVSQLEELIQCQNPKETLDVCKSVYQLLETKLCRSSRSDTGKEIFHIIEGQEDTVNKLKVLKMFWVYDTFVSADKMSFQWTENTMPYLYKVPREIIQYKKLLSTCGVREEFEVNDYINVLEELRHNRREHPLEPPECKIALILLRELCEKTISNVDLEDKDVYVPDNNNVLRSSKDLTFNDDAPWLQQSSHYTFAHGDVPWSHAEKLGIVAARYKKAQEFSSLMGFAHEFGQTEELTNRLKDILKAYPGGSEIFKELLQNADDAKATEIHIIYDQRSHPSEMIVGDSWATMQKRPAICVYNNRVFSDEILRVFNRSVLVVKEVMQKQLDNMALVSIQYIT